MRVRAVSLLVSVEEAFRTLKSDLAIRPIFHQDEVRIEAHVFLAFLAYCLCVTLGQKLKALAPGLTERSALEKFAAMQRAMYTFRPPMAVLAGQLDRRGHRAV